MKWLYIALMVAQCLQNILAAKILALCTVASHSHSLWCYQYMAALAERGHQLTVLGLDEPKIKISNLTMFIAKGVYEATYINNTVSHFSMDTKISLVFRYYRLFGEASTLALMNSEALRDLIKQNENIKKPFDLIIHDHCTALALLGLVPLFGSPPLILATTFGTPQWMVFQAGNVFNPAYVPSMITSSGQYMTFYERCLNTFYYVMLELYTRFVTDPFQDQLMREVFGSHLPHVRDIVRQANIIIVNHHYALNGPRPTLPGIVEIAGLHIADQKPLPKDLKDFMDGADHGVIQVSFGSNVNSSWFAEGFENMLTAAFRQLPQRVLWKWDKDLPNIPPNVKLSKWMPQSDLLAHPKMQLFITHCGLLSTQEAIYRKVPVLALPVFCDQMDNADTLVRHNLTIKLDVHKITAEQLLGSIKEILSNPMYKRNMERMGDLMTDMPLTSRQQAVFWTEYAIRHQGAAHLHSAAADMSWIQLLLLDVVATALLISLVILWLVKTLLSIVVRKLISTSKRKMD